MTKQEVKEKMKHFVDLVLREKELQEKLLKLTMRTGDKKELQNRIAQHDRMIEEIEDIRQNKILPMMEEMAAFIDQRRKEIEEEKKAGGEKFDEEEYYSLLFDANTDLGTDESFKKFLENIAPELLESELPDLPEISE